jgi:hypothetical protein
MATTLKRQFITDAEGNPIGVILPLEEYALIEQILEQRLSDPKMTEKIALVEQAANESISCCELSMLFL